jgi:hypothetical protein
MSSIDEKTKLTTVKLLKDVYLDFKRLSLDSNITLQKLVNRGLHKYTNDEAFRNEVDSHRELQISGSQF